MNTNSSEAKNQQVPAGRRGFLRKISVAAGALATASVPLHAGAVEAVAGLPRDANGFVIPAPHDELKTLKEYNSHMLAQVCLMAELMREWYKANQTNIQRIWPEAEAELYDFMFEQYAATRVVARAAGVELDRAFIAKQAAAYRLKSTGGAA